MTENDKYDSRLTKLEVGMEHMSSTMDVILVKLDNIVQGGKTNWNLIIAGIAVLVTAGGVMITLEDSAMERRFSPVELKADYQERDIHKLTELSIKNQETFASYAAEKNKIDTDQSGRLKVVERRIILLEKQVRDRGL